MLSSQDYSTESIKSILESESDYLNYENFKLLITYSRQEDIKNFDKIFDHFTTKKLKSSMDKFDYLAHQYYSDVITCQIYLQ